MDVQQERLKKDEMERMIVDVEKRKAQVLKPLGNELINDNSSCKLTTAEMDERFFHRHGHIDNI